MEVLDNKCPACGAKITFNPRDQMWDCEYCGSKFTLDEMKKHNNASSDDANKVTNTEKKTDNKLSLDVYRCKNCGAEVIADETTTATFCVYCGSTTILKDRINDGVAPGHIIPFKKVKEDAISAFKGLSKGRPLMPKLFNNPNNIEKISGVYIPFWLYDLKASGDISFNCTDVSSWSDYNYRYTKTSRYISKRECKFTYNKILVDGSSRFDDDLMDSLEPFKLDEMVEYNHAYLSGFLAEKYDVDCDKAIERASLRAMNTTVDELKDSVNHGSVTVKENNLKINKTSDEFILLPVFMVNLKYKDEQHTFAMNGQTGEIVGNIPLNVGKTIILTITIFVVSFLIVYVLFNIRG